MKFLTYSIAMLGVSYALTAPVSVAQPPTLSDFEEGQVWSYKTRSGEEGSTLLINKIEEDPKLGFIYHISIFDVKVKNAHQAGGVASELPHFPVSQKTLDESVVTLLRSSGPHPDYLEGYEHWREAFDAGQAGVFTISISEIIDVIEKTLNQPH